MNRTHFTITPATIIALAAAVGAQVIAVAPNWKPQVALALQIVGIVVPAAFLVANAILGHGAAQAQAAVTNAAALVAQQPAVLHVVPAPEPPPSIAPREAVTLADVDARAVQVARDEVLRFIQAGAAAQPVAPLTPVA